MLFDYAYKDTTFFLISKFFLTFFILFFVVCKDAYLFRSFRVARGRSLSVGACSPLLCCPAIIRTHIHTHAHARARGFLDYKFLDITVIFRLPRNF